MNTNRTSPPDSLGSPSGSPRAVACEDCQDTGYVGDNGPGIRGNREYQECGCMIGRKTDDEKWRDHFVYPIALEMRRRGIGELRIKLKGDGKADFELLPENVKVDSGDEIALSPTPCCAVAEPSRDQTGLDRRRDPVSSLTFQVLGGDNKEIYSQSLKEEYLNRPDIMEVLLNRIFLSVKASESDSFSFRVFKSQPVE